MSYEDECIWIYKVGETLLKKNIKWKKPEKVWVTALGLIKRYFLRKHLIQMNALNAVKVALILAAKIEDVNINISKTLKVLNLFLLGEGFLTSRSLDWVKKVEITRVLQIRIAIARRVQVLYKFCESLRYSWVYLLEQVYIWALFFSNWFEKVFFLSLGILKNLIWQFDHGIWNFSKSENQVEFSRKKMCPPIAPLFKNWFVFSGEPSSVITYSYF